MGFLAFFPLMTIGVFVPLIGAKVDDSSFPKPTFSLKGPVAVLYVQGKTIAEVVHEKDGQLLECRLHELEEEEDSEAIIKNSSLPAKFIPFKSMLHLIKDCNRFPLNESHAVSEDDLLTLPAIDMSNWSSWSVWRGILPGTKWCGMGDMATRFEDLGQRYEVDKCCRAHDLCPTKLKSFRSGYGLINFSFYTKSHCDCDREFYGCLKETRNQYADVVGNVYFNVLRTQCLKDRQTFICVQNQTSTDASTACTQWEIDPNNKKMQMSVSPIKY